MNNTNWWFLAVDVAAPFVLGFIGWALKKWLEAVIDTVVDLKITPVVETVGALSGTVSAIQTSLEQTNGGSSVRDSLNRMEKLLEKAARTPRKPAAKRTTRT